MRFFRICWLMGALLSFAYCWGESVDTTFAAGNDAWARGEYADAVQHYNALLQNGHAPEIYLNLAKAHEKLGERGQAILAYARASFYFKNAEAMAALQKFDIHVSWFEGWPQTFAYTTWRSIAAWTFWLALSIFLAAFIFRIRGGRMLACLFATACLVSVYATWANGRNHLKAILVGTPVVLKVSPTATSPTIRTLTDGTFCRTTTEQNGHVWVTLSNGETGWVERSQVHNILGH